MKRILFIILLLWNVAEAQLIIRGNPFYVPLSSGIPYRTITIDHTKVPNTNQTDFPILISGTYSYLATVANGGKVTDAQGDDIQFYSDAGLTTKLKWDVERYVATTGEFIAHVKIPSLTTATDVTIYMSYGDVSVTTYQGDRVNTWNSGYVGVWHLPDGTSLTANDATANSHNGTLQNTPTAITGKIDGGAGFVDGTGNQYINTTISSNLSGSFTFSAWINVTTLAPGLTRGFVTSEVSSYSNYWATLGGTGGAPGQISFSLYDGSDNPSAVGTIITGAWHYVVGVRNTGTDLIYLYINGTLSQSVADNTGTVPSYSAFNIGKQVSPNRPSSGNIDEVRISNTIRSADWITAEYNNQSSPSTFYTIGSEQ